MWISSSDDGDDIGSVRMWEQQAESTQEKSSEQATKDRAKKAAQDLKKTQQDEHKLDFWNEALQQIIRDLLEEKKSTQLLSAFVDVFEDDIPEHILVGILTLNNAPILQSASDHLGVTISPKQDSEPLHLEVQAYKEPIHPSLQTHINDWFRVLEATIKKDPSQLATKKMIDMLTSESISHKVETLIQNIFGTYFYKQGIKITPSKAKGYTDFVLAEIQKNLKGVSFDMEWFANIKEAEGTTSTLSSDEK